MLARRRVYHVHASGLPLAWCETFKVSVWIASRLMGFTVAAQRIEGVVGVSIFPIRGVIGLYDGHLLWRKAMCV